DAPVIGLLHAGRAALLFYQPRPRLAPWYGRVSNRRFLFRYLGTGTRIRPAPRDHRGTGMPLQAEIFQAVGLLPVNGWRVGGQRGECAQRLIHLVEVVVIVIVADHAAQM